MLRIDVFFKETATPDTSTLALRYALPPGSTSGMPLFKLTWLRVSTRVVQ